MVFLHPNYSLIIPEQVLKTMANSFMEPQTDLSYPYQKIEEITLIWEAIRHNVLTLSRELEYWRGFPYDRTKLE